MLAHHSDHCRLGTISYPRYRKLSVVVIERRALCRPPVICRNAVRQKWFTLESICQTGPPTQDAGRATTRLRDRSQLSGRPLATDSTCCAETLALRMGPSRRHLLRVPSAGGSTTRTNTWNNGNARAFWPTVAGAPLVNRYAPHILCAWLFDRCAPRYPRALCRRLLQAWA
jgi:hypothetical protein